MTSQKVALSFSGAGHLLPYHLGAGRVLLSKLPVSALCGSSSGAIAATALAVLPNVDDYAREFIQTRGRALGILRGHIQQEGTKKPKFPLHIALTRCRDGASILKQAHNVTDEEFFTLLKASCSIPQTFHPHDLLSSSFTPQYPDTDGIWVQDDYYVDGGIAAPAPRLPDQDMLVVSPIVGNAHVSPTSGWWPSLRLRHDFRVQASLVNLRALMQSMGATQGDLERWYERGQADAHAYLEKRSGECR